MRTTSRPAPITNTVPGDAGRFAAAARAAAARNDPDAAELAARAAGAAAANEGLADDDNPFDPAADRRLHDLWNWHHRIGSRAAREIRARGEADLFTPDLSGDAA